MIALGIIAAVLAILLVVWFFTRKQPVARTTSINVRFGENMSTPTGSTGTVALGGGNVLVTVQPLLASGLTNFSATVTSATFTVADATIVSFTTDATSATLTPLAVGATAVSVVAVITDSDGVVMTLTGTGTLTVTEDVSGIRTVAVAIQFS